MKYPILLIAILACITGYAQSPIQNLKNGIDTAITNKTATHSVTPYAVGTQMKAIADTVNTYFTKKTDTLQYSRIYGTPAALPPNGGAGGSLAGSYPNPMLNSNSVGVTQINATSPTAGQVLSWNGTSLAWSSVSGVGVSVVGVNDIKVLSGDTITNDTTYLTTNQYSDTIQIFNQPFNTGGLPVNHSISLSNTAYWTTGSNGALNFSGNAGVYTDYIHYNDTTMMENAILQTTFIYKTKVPAINSLGIELGFNSVHSVGAAQHNVRMGLCMSGANKGKIFIDQNPNTNTITYSSVSNTNINYNDTFDLTLQPTSWAMIATVHNRTQNWTISYTYGTSAATFYNAANCNISHLADSESILKWNLSSITPNYTLYLFAGYSITLGQGASVLANRWVNNALGQGNNKVAAGGGDEAEQLAGCMKEFLLLHPRAIVFDGGLAAGNDLIYGTPIAQWQASCLRSYNSCLSAGIIPIICLATPRTSLDVRPVNNWIMATFPAAYIVDMYTPLHDTSTAYAMLSIYSSGDGVHPNDSGHIVMARTFNGNNLVKKIYTAARKNNDYIFAASSPDASKASLINSNSFTSNNTFLGGLSINSRISYQQDYLLNPSGNVPSIDTILTKVDGTGTITLPVSGVVAGQELYVYHYGAVAGTVTISGVINSSGGSTQNLSTKQGLHLMYNGIGAWMIINAYSGYVNIIPNNGSATSPSIKGNLDVQGEAGGYTYKLNPTFTPDSSNNIIAVDGTGTVTMPTTGIKIGQKYTLYHYGASAGVVTVSSLLPSNVVLSPYQAIHISWNGSNWRVDASHGLSYIGSLTASGNGSNTMITIAHNLTGISSSSSLQITPRSSAAGSFLYADVDATNIYIYYSIAPASGTNNLKYSYAIKP